jgi:carboxyl-terminal processing protease
VAIFISVINRKIFLIVSFLCVVFFAVGQKTNDCAHATKLIQLLNENHIQPLAWNSSSLREVSREFLRQIDPYHIYFSLEDVEEIKALPFSSDRPTNDEFCGLALHLAEIVQKKLKKTEAEIDVYLKPKLNYAEKDSFAVLTAELQSTSTRQKLHLHNYLKHEVLEQMSILADTTTPEALLKWESQSREKVRNREKKKLQKLLSKTNTPLDFTVGALLKSIAAMYDPHSSYFTNEEMVDFQNGLSSSILSYGLDFLEDETGELSVNSLVPGGAAWQSNEIHEGDVIVSIKWDDNEKISASDFSPSEMRDKLELNKNRKAEIAIRKKDGTTSTVTLVKSTVESDDNRVDGYVLKGKRKIGYIALPAFYTNWNGKDLKGCANDVAAELIKLKKENIEGLILDLRFNGGGSIKEAVELAGIFINVGPLMVLQTKGQPLFTLKDTTPGAAYSGPLVIITNGLSASASEMVAASLQDHQRALIVGTPTFGKSNGQSLIPIIEKDTTAHVKATTVRLYRITGKSYQQKGVQPDILLPDFSQHLGYSEKNLPRALLTDSITKKTYYTPLLIPPLSELRKKSNQRISQNKFFQQFEKPMAHLRHHIPLDITAFTRYCVENSKGFENITSLSTTAAHFTVTQNRFNNMLLQVDENRNSQDVEFAHELEQSPYLQEVFQILVDYIELENRK